MNGKIKFSLSPYRETTAKEIGLAKSGKIKPIELDEVSQWKKITDIVASSKSLLLWFESTVACACC